MGDVGLARETFLSLVGFFTETIGLDDERYFTRIKIAEGVDKDPVGRIFVEVDRLIRPRLDCRSLQRRSW